MSIKKNLPLIAGITIPILLILFVAGSIYLPGLFVKPKYNFLYMTGPSYGQPYLVANGKLEQNTATSSVIGPTAFPPNYAPTQNLPRLFVYDVRKNQSESISFADAQKLSLDTNPQSSDGFSIVSGGNDGGSFLFGGAPSDSYYTKYLTGHNISRKLNLPNQENYYANFTFLGWINN
jgi:hypothetical protein